MQNALATPGDRSAAITRALASRREVIRKLLPPGYSPDRMIELSRVAVATTPALLKCSTASVCQAIVEAMKAGLEIGTATQEACIVPYKGKAQFQVMYRGMMKLVRRCIPNIPIWSGAVRDGDEFDFNEGKQELSHKRAEAGKRGDLRYAYACARMPDGFVNIKIVDADDIKRARATSNSTAWDTHESAMWEKTAIKRLCKTLPMPEAVARVIQLDDTAGTDEQDLDTDWMIGEPT